MNSVQLASALRMGVIFLGGIGVSKGFVTQEQVAQASDVTTLTQVASAAAAIGTFAYGLWVRRPAGLVNTVTKIPGVDKVVASTKIVDKLPENMKVQSR